MKNDKDFSKIYDKKGKLIGCLNFNNMLPVNESVLQPIDIRPYASDSQKDRAYKALLNNQLDWCNANYDAIVLKAKNYTR